jgi:hypothetical protein
MTVTAENAKKMLFTLRYPPDKVIDVYEGSFTAAASSSSSQGERTHHTIDHSFGTAPLLNMTYSLDGGTTWQDQNVAIPDLSGATPVFQTLEASAYSTSTQVVVVASSYHSTPKTVTYRVLALARE